MTHLMGGAGGEGGAGSSKLLNWGFVNIVKKLFGALRVIGKQQRDCFKIPKGRCKEIEESLLKSSQYYISGILHWIRSIQLNIFLSLVPLILPLLYPWIQMILICIQVQ